MHLEKLTLYQFRNYEKEEVFFGPCMNMIVGENAQGKTNLLEAISLLSTGKSFRTPHLQDIIRAGSSGFHIEACFTKEGVSQTLSLSFDGTNKKIQHNQTHYASFISLLGILPSVLIVPEDVSILSGSPSDRRRFLDLHIAQIDPLYVYHLGRYYKAIKQRNSLLKQGQESTLDVWEKIMAHAASYLTQQRQKHIGALSSLAAPFLQQISAKQDALVIHYVSSISCDVNESELAYVKQWQKNRKRDLYVGTTLSGPHRDDMTICINGKEAKLFASEGQKRCCLAALKLAQREIFQESLGSSPLMGIDDFGIHLDTSRSAYLLSRIERLGQTFLTSPVRFAAFDTIKHKQFISVHLGSVIQETVLDDENKPALEQTF